jgi:hypothetical protein
MKARAEGMCRKALTAAFPPCCRILSPHFAARGCVHAMMPSVLCTTLRRLGKGMKSRSVEGGIIFGFSGILKSGGGGTFEVEKGVCCAVEVVG